MIQLSLSDYHGPHEATDVPRFKGAKGRIWDALQTGKWFDLHELARLTGALETSVSIRLREFLGPNGEHLVEKRHLGGGHWIYRLKP